MSTTAQSLYDQHQNKWTKLLEKDPSLPSLLAEKCDPLLFSGEESHVLSGLNILLSFGDSSLITLLQVTPEEYVLNEKYRANQRLLERCLCRLISAPSAGWYGGWKLGWFDGMLFRSAGDIPVDELSEDMKSLLLKGSRRMVEIQAVRL